MNIRVVTLGSGRLSRGKTIALAIAAVAVGGIFLALGIALLASLAAVGAVVAAVLTIARVFRGQPSLPARERPLDPSMEVFPPSTGEAERLDSGHESP